jgi:5-methylcytosine-specific restriction endonuclease McrA
MCKTLVKKEENELIEQIKQQLAAKDDQMKEEKAAKDEQIKERLAAMKERLEAKDEQLAAMKERLAAMKEQMKERLAAMREQLAAKDEQLAAMKEILGAKDEEFATNNDERSELTQTNKKQKTEDSKEKKGSKGTRKLKMTEPERRKIAMRQNWKCNDPLGLCRLKDKQLEEYDVDHIIRPSRGGKDTPENMQALCPACHRKKTELENLEDFEELKEQVDKSHNVVIKA